MSSRYRWLCALFAIATLVASERASAQASYGQYLVVIDDSGSMDHSDPRRLVVLASMALAAALEDGDQVMLVGLNELATGLEGGAAGPAFVSPRELLRDRDGGERVIDPSGERVSRLGQHDGETPCRHALDRARQILDSAASAGAPQTLLFLTDGACNGGELEPASRWLPGLRSHAEGRFRFVFLTADCPHGACTRSPLAEYASATGWRGEIAISLDARSLLRAFAGVLSFSRGLRYDEGGRVGLERTFAGARAVRALAIRDRGEGAIALERTTRAGSGRPITGGPTYRDPAHGWSFRTARTASSAEPFAVRSSTPGVDVLVIPVYGRLRLEAIVAGCGGTPPLPWTNEVTVRAGEPACAYARLVGDAGDAITPDGSFEFGITVDGSPMLPGDGGSFHAQLGALAEGRHERRFEASGGALAEPVLASRGVSAMRFGVQRVTVEGREVTEVDLGALPRPVTSELSLRYEGAFPPAARGRARCEVEASPGLARCIECTLRGASDLALTDGLEIHAEVRAAPLCAAISESDGAAQPIRLRVVLEPAAAGELVPHALPLQARLVYPRAQPIELSLTAGETIAREVRVPGPRMHSALTASASDWEGLEVRAEGGEVHAGEDGLVSLPVRVSASDCCTTGVRDLELRVTVGESAVEVPLRVEVRPASFWTCPGKQIAMALAALLGLLLLGWIVHGWVTPARFSKGALLLSAPTLDELASLRDGDDGWRRLERFSETRRGFRRPAAVWLGGPRAPLPSLKRQPPDGRIEAQPGGGATLLVTGPGISRWSETEGKFVELEKGSYPVPSKVRLARGEELFIELRR